MTTTLTKAPKAKGKNDIAALASELAALKASYEHLVRHMAKVIPNDLTLAEMVKEVSWQPASPRPSPLDQAKEVISATADLRVGNGNLSADRVAKLFGVSLSQLADWLGRSRQAVSKTPDADSLQNGLAFFEHVARMRVAMADAEFRKWLRTPNELLGKKSPLDLMAKGQWQVMADYVDDALTGAPT